MMKVLDGSVVETRFAWPETNLPAGETHALVRTQVAEYERDQVAYVHGTADARARARTCMHVGRLTVLPAPPRRTCV